MHHSTFIGHLASIYRPKTYVELGLYEGETLRLVQPHAGHVYGVDMKMNGHLEQLGRIPNVTINTCMTNEFFDTFAGTIDMAFIDADHRLESVQQDFENVLSRLNPGGVILLHDTDPREDWLIDPGYCGDSYKIVKLFEGRTDINIVTLPITEAGLSIVTRKDNTRTALRQSRISPS